MIVVMAAPTSTTNITGLRMTVAGIELPEGVQRVARADELAGPDARCRARRWAASSFISSVSGVRTSGGVRPRVGSASRAGTVRGGRQAGFSTLGLGTSPVIRLAVSDSHTRDVS